CIASTTLTQGDVNSGSVSNTATVNGTPPSGATPNPTTANDTETVTITRSPSVTIDKVGTLDNTVVNPAARTDAGDKINYTFSVTNTGNVTLTNVTITDPAFPSLSCSVATLAPGGTYSTCIASTTLTQGDVNSGSVSNTATVNGTPPSGATPNPTTANDTETVTITQVATISLSKSVTPTTFGAAGQVLVYTFTITNTGNVTLAGPFSITD